MTNLFVTIDDALYEAVADAAAESGLSKKALVSGMIELVMGGDATAHGDAARRAWARYRKARKA